MLSLGLLGLTSYRRSSCIKAYEGALHKIHRADRRIVVTCEEVSPDLVMEMERTAGGEIVQLQVELLCGYVSEVQSVVQREFVRLSWANRSALKGRIAVLNPRSPNFEELLKLALSEGLVGLGLVGSDVEADALLQQVQAAMADGTEVETQKLPIWLISADFLSLTQGVLRVVASRDVKDVRIEEVFHLPGGHEGLYSKDSILPEPSSVPFDLEGRTRSLIDYVAASATNLQETITPASTWWDWVVESNEVPKGEEGLKAREQNMSLYIETRQLS